jgi:hypothetical protein
VDTDEIADRATPARAWTLTSITSSGARTGRCPAAVGEAQKDVYFPQPGSKDDTALRLLAAQERATEEDEGRP